MLQFEEKTGAANMTIDDLRRTLALGDSTGKMPAAVPLVHSELIDTVIQKANTIGIPIEIPPLVVRERYCNKRKGAVDNSPENYIVNRMVGKVYFNDWYDENTNDKMRPALAFSYVYDGTLRGIQISFGQNVSVCDNLTCFGEFTFSTNGGSKVPFDKGLQLLDGWMQNYKRIIGNYNSRIANLKKVMVDKQTLNLLVGDLFTRAVMSNNGDRKVVAPLNQSEVGAMVNKGFNALQAINGSAITGWDVMNWGTAVLKPNNSDMTTLISSTAAFNDYIYEALCVPVGEQPITFGEAVTQAVVQLPALKEEPKAANVKNDPSPDGDLF